MCAYVCFEQCLYFLFFLHIYSFMKTVGPSVLCLCCAPTLSMSEFKKHLPVQSTKKNNVLSVICLKFLKCNIQKEAHVKVVNLDANCVQM